MRHMLLVLTVSAMMALVLGMAASPIMADVEFDGDGLRSSDSSVLLGVDGGDIVLDDLNDSGITFVSDGRNRFGSLHID